MPDAITLPPRALLAWRLESGLGSVMLGAIAFVVGWVWFDNHVVRLTVLAGATVAAILLVVELVVLLPRRHAAWRARVDESVLEVFEGVLVVRRLRVPLRQVLYVDVRQGPVVRALGLTRVRVGTLGSAHDVGPISPDVADALALHLVTEKS